MQTTSLGKKSSSEALIKSEKKAMLAVNISRKLNLLLKAKVVGGCLLVEGLKQVVCLTLNEVKVAGGDDTRVRETLGAEKE